MEHWYEDPSLNPYAGWDSWAQQRFREGAKFAEHLPMAAMAQIANTTQDGPWLQGANWALARVTRFHAPITAELHNAGRLGGIYGV